MLRNMRFFIFSDSSLHLREVRFFKVKLLGSGLLLGLLVLGLILLVNYVTSDPLGLGYDRMSLLSTENRILKDQLHDLSKKMGFVQRALDRLAERGNELRLQVDLKQIDADTREASVGGTKEEVTNPFLVGDADGILSKARTLVERLTHEVQLQQTSYEEISRRVQYNKVFFTHIPAIKPMAGHYSINGFGMRLHPVLHVYRMHEGIDITNDVGTNVYAAGDGTVHFAGRTAGGYGVVVEINHGFGYASLYAHLSQVLVKPGQAVKRGELIAKSGRSGLVSGPHLHYEVRLNGWKQNPVDYFFDDVNAARYRTLLASTKNVRGEH